MKETRRRITWTALSRIIGLVIVIALLVAFLLGRPLDRPIALAFLGIATGLLGLPSGYSVVKRNGERRNGRS